MTMRGSLRIISSEKRREKKKKKDRKKMVYTLLRLLHPLYPEMIWRFFLSFYRSFYSLFDFHTLSHTTNHTTFIGPFSAGRVTFVIKSRWSLLINFYYKIHTCNISGGEVRE